MHFSLRQLEVFAAIARTQNVSEAALDLGMSQSAASTALAELERRSDRRLFDRAGKRIRLNEAGQVMLPQVLELLARAQELDMLLSGSNSPGPLRLGATVTIGNYIAPRLIEAYRRAYPDAAITLEVGNTEAMAGRVADFDLDLALLEGEHSNPDIAFQRWMDDELVVFCAPGHPLAALRTVSIDRVLEEKWAVREQGSGTRQALDRAMVPYWSRWTVGIALQQMEAIKQTVQAGGMIGCLPRLAVADAFATGALVQLSVPNLNLMRRFYLATHRAKYWTAGMRAFVALCRMEEGQV